MMPHDIGLVVCYFGREWPAYFPYFLASCAGNPGVDFLIFTNLAPPPAAPNVRFIALADLAAFNALATRQLGLPIALTDPYKLCDLKPAYGVIFADYLRPYRFWGYCDVDLLFGDIRRFITDEVLRDYDVVSAVAEYPAGFFLLLRNEPAVTRLYAASRDYQRVFQSPRHFCFDECNFKFGELLGAGRRIEEVATEIESMASVISTQARQGGLRVYARTLGEEFIQQQAPVRWQAGQLHNTATGAEYLLVHLVNVKTRQTFGVEPGGAGQPCFVSHYGITRRLRPGWLTRQRGRLTRAAGRLRRARWLLWSMGQQWQPARRPLPGPLFDGACYLIGNLKCVFYHQEGSRYCIVAEFGGQLTLQQCQVLAAGPGRYVVREQNQVSLLSTAAGPGLPLKLELLNLQSHAREVGYLFTANELPCS